MTALLLMVLCATPDAGPPVAQFLRGAKVVRAARVMAGARVSFAIADPPAQGLSEHEQDLNEAFAAVDRIFRDAEREREGSMVALLEAGAGGEAVELSPGACELLDAAIAAEKRSDGAFHFVRLVTDGGAVEGTAKEVELKGCRARLKHAGARLELGQLPLAAAVDAVVKAWRAKGYRDFNVSAGPVQYWAGAVGDQPWVVDVAHAGRSIGHLEPAETALATFGDEPETTVRVEAKKAVDALMLAMRVRTMAPDAGLKALAAAGAKGLYVDGAGAVKRSPALILLP